MTFRLSGSRLMALRSEKTMMIRPIALAAMLGALIAGIAVYVSPPGWWRGAAPLFGGLDKTAVVPEDWPICTTMAHARGPGGSSGTCSG